jgi:exonuclease SbcC
MILKSVELRNIRSYLSQEIKFPEGSVLLEGDIGAGKSTILLAIEFALFGIIRGNLSGNSLLRNGKNEGSVELTFDINNKEVTIKRTLKKVKGMVQQNSGYMIKDGVKKEGTAIELKSAVLDLLGYPKELITKSKSLIYRYTVYTPQEEMKLILAEDKDIRLDTLRKVFGIDKYKRIRENAVVYIRVLKEKNRELEGKIFDLEEKKKNRKEKNNEAKGLVIKIDDINSRLKKIKAKIENKKKELELYEIDIKKLDNLKKEIELANINLNNKLEERRRNNEEIKALENAIVILNKEVEEKESLDPRGISKQIEDKTNQISLMEKTINEISSKISELKTEEKQSINIKSKISEISKCPTCEQEVSAAHKNSINQRENEKLSKLSKELETYKERKGEAVKWIEKLKEELEKLRREEKALAIRRIKEATLREKLGSRNKLFLLQEKLKKEVGKINSKKIELNKEVEELKGVDELFRKSKRELDIILRDERELEIQKASLSKELEGIREIISSLDEEIKTKEEAKKSMVYIKNLQHWLEKYFMNLMQVIEKHVMMKVHREFDELFQRWFNILIEDETINVRLDDEFTPIVEQNGYENEIENLSGGERTSCALAYRLSLNKVINDIIPAIRTKDIIILDEPTDGFSTEQLDKVREVLDQLDNSQIIIVSHESKIESFVDNIIRIRKEEHVSEVV